MNEEKIYYLAVDIGASSGRHILAHLENGKIVLEEMYRFPNGMDEENGHKVWDTERLFREIKTGMKKCCEAGKIPVSMAIDTWAVDYVLLDENDEKLGPCFAYRDSRTEGQDSEVYKVISEKELYDRTGIQKAIFNTIYQLKSVKEQHPEWLRKAGSFLMVPDYLNFLLTGVKKQEYTNASTTQLLDAVSCDWDRELIKKLGFPDKLFGELSMPGTVVKEKSRNQSGEATGVSIGNLKETADSGNSGNLKETADSGNSGNLKETADSESRGKCGCLLPEVIEEVGFDCKVILPATHDTGSAVMSVPTVSEDVLYISSGTWSLLGTELLAPELSEEAHDANFTNEGGFDHRFRFLKNIMGLWMIQSVQKELIADYDLYIEKVYEASGPKMQDKRENAGEFHNSGDILGETEEISIEDAKKYFSFANLCAKAKEASINSVVDANDSRFLAPASMIEEVKAACRESGQQVPETPWEIARVIYHSLAVCYKKAVKEIEDITKKRYETIHIVGGGSNAEWLNELTAKETGLKVIAGPGEATAIGNIGAQMIASGVYEDLWMFRKAVSESFDVKCYKPEE